MVDYHKKSTDPVEFKAYKGYPGIIADGVKDMKNNFIGSAYGVMHPQAGSCDKFLKKGK
ncbi:MAG: hypothetical protein J6B00_03380 [Alphaproteobacteria bacterium]|nr:hypothetical protein [Alphaproteobacteria bacterium]MBO5441083.1 hypothetical protein [Alphaproteobacteria bacterium]